MLTAKLDENGHYTFTNAAGQYLITGATGNSLTFGDAPSDYSLWTLKTVTGGFHIVSVNAQYNGNAQALEVYNSLFTTFAEKDNDYYRFNLYKLTDEQPTGESGLPSAGDSVVIFNQSAQGVLSTQDGNTESPSLNNAAATVAEGAATAANGGLVFTVEKNGAYYRFVNETFGYREQRLLPKGGQRGRRLDSGGVQRRLHHGEPHRQVQRQVRPVSGVLRRGL